MTRLSGLSGPRDDAELANLLWQRDDLARQVAKKYEIAEWVAINQFVSISWESWHTLEDIVKRAIGLEIEDLARKRQQSSVEQERKLESLMAKENSSLKFPNQPSNTINRFLS